jgi:hypothetical protein
MKYSKTLFFLALVFLAGTLTVSTTLADKILEKSRVKNENNVSKMDTKSRINRAVAYAGEEQDFEEYKVHLQLIKAESTKIAQSRQCSSEEITRLIENLYQFIRSKPNFFTEDQIYHIQEYFDFLAPLYVKCKPQMAKATKVLSKAEQSKFNEYLDIAVRGASEGQD